MAQLNMSEHTKSGFEGQEQRLGEAVALQLLGVVGVDVVDADDGIALAEQSCGGVEADKTGGAGDDDGLLRLTHEFC